MMRTIALALALGVGAVAHAEEGDDNKAKAEAPSAAKVQILDPAAHNLVRLDTLTLGSETDSAAHGAEGIPVEIRSRLSLENRGV